MFLYDYTSFHKFYAAWQKAQERAKSRHAHQNKVVFPLAARHVGRGETCVSNNKFHIRSSLECEEKLDSFDVVASFKNSARGAT